MTDGIKTLNTDLTYRPSSGDWANGVLSQFNIGGGDSNFGSSIWSAVGDIDGVVNNGKNPDQQASAAQGLIQNILNILSSLGTGESAAASSETSKNNSNASKAVNLSESQKAEIETAFTKIQGELDGQNKIIEDAKDAAKDIAKKLEEEKKAKVDKTLEKIEAYKQELGQTTDPTKQKELLDNITVELGNLAGSFKVIEGLKEQLATNSKNVEDAYNKITDLSKQGEEQSDESIKKLESTVSQEQKNITDNTKTETKAPVNEATSVEVGAAAKAASSNPYTMGEAPQLYRTSADQGSAASIRTIGSATVWVQIANGLKNVANGGNLLTTFNNTIGSAISNCNDLVGDWNGVLKPMITGFGSMDTFKSDIEEFGTIVEEDKNTVNSRAGKQNVVEDKGNTEKPKSNPEIRNKLINTTSSGSQKEEYKNDLLTPRAQLKFGI